MACRYFLNVFRRSSASLREAASSLVPYSRYFSNAARASAFFLSCE